MKLGIMQPYFLPYIGYFQLINAVDRFVIYDDANYIKQGWINRNRILLNGKEYNFNLNVSGASSFKQIKEIGLGNNRDKLLKTIFEAYRKAPYFEETIHVLKEILNFETNNLSAMITFSINVINSRLGINSEILHSSDLEKDNNQKGEEKVISICKMLGATQYLNAIGGIKLYSKERFKSEKIELSFLKPDYIEYQQFRNKFIPGLSVIDVLMFNSTDKIIKMLGQYELI